VHGEFQFLSISGFRQLGTIGPRAIWPSCFSICWRLSPGSPGGARAVMAESVLVKQQLLILNRSRRRSPDLRLADPMVAGLCALLNGYDG
jgi:hypothetical protein